MSIVVPAILPSSRRDLKEKLALLTKLPMVTRIQIDIVDGKFAAPASWPYTAPAEFTAMIASEEMLPRVGDIEYEIDCMCIDAELIAAAWLSLGATRLTFHAETVSDLPRFLSFARNQYGAGAAFTPRLISFGLAISIASELSLIEPCLGDIGYVQFMGIARIGRQGQPFDERVLEKVRVFHHRHPEIPIQVDGGISLQSAKKLVSLGVSNLVIGSAILTAGDPAAAVRAFEELSTPYGV